MAFPDVRLASVGKRHFLFLPHNQKLFYASDTTMALWPRLAAGLSVAEFVSAASAGGANGRQSLTELLDSGAVRYLAPRSGPVPVTARMCLSIGGHAIGICCTGERTARLVRSAFEHLLVADTPAQDQLVLIEEASRAGLAWAGEDPEWHRWDEIGAALKFMLTTQVLDLSEDPVLHTATVSAAGGSMLLCGDPGSGKSTLSVALHGEGFRLEGDDLAVLRSGGQVMSLPFPATLKCGSLPLLAQRLPGLEDLPDYLRPDGKRVRYRALDAGAFPARPVRCVLFLDRSPDTPAGLAPVTAEEEIIRMMLASCWSPDDRLSGDGFESLAALIGSARFFRARFDGLDQACGLAREAWSLAGSG